jgi:cytidylate kinase
LIISREKGAGGNALARLVGKRLGWQAFDNEIVDEIAQKAHIRRQLIESLDERARTTIRDEIARMLHLEPMETQTYLASLHEVLLTLGHQGDVIIIGHGAQYILPRRFGLRVRLVAPLEERVRRIAGRENLGPEAAQQEAERTDRERAQFARRDFGRDLTDPLSYDLIINTAEVAIEAVAEVVMTALQRKLTLGTR